MNPMFTSITNFDVNKWVTLLTKFITLFHIEICAIVLSIIGFISLIITFIMRWKYTVKTKQHVDEIGEFGITIENTKLTKIHNVALKTGITTFALAIVCLFIYGCIFSKAKKYGAYGDFYKKNTLAEIKYNIDHGFIDQSAEVPTDPKGCVIIFFKWGCPDCANVHNDLLKKLKEYDLFKTYFVSVQSDKGQQLIRQYPIDSVPSGIYIYYDMNSGVEYQQKVLNDGTKLNEYNLDTLLSVQLYIRTFELPAQYASDAPKEMPKRYRMDKEDSPNSKEK